MEQETLKVLAVADPAVEGYLDEELGILKGYGGRVDFHIVPWADYYPMMMKAFAGEADYDIVMVAGHLWLRDFVEKGYLSELDFEEEDILPVIAEEMRYKGKAYLSPSFCDGHMILYRKSLLHQVLGKELENVITPQEYIETAKAYKEACGKQAVAMKADQSEIFTDALPFLRMYGGDAYDLHGTAACGKEETVKGLQSYVELKTCAVDGTEAFGNGEIALAIREKRAAMAVTWSGQMGEVFKKGCLEPWDLGFCTFSTAWNVTWSFGICLSSGKKKAAEEFLKYLRSPEVDGKVGKKSGAPVRRGSYLEGAGECPWFPVQQKMMELAKPLPRLSKAGEKNGVFYEKIFEAFTGKKTAQEAMREAGQAIDSMI
ncbi:extracellular solute-binding protein [Lacrimispora indolis]|uniref:extracellular solute-binding protein n=1 Tax=Lacrimispora indolis TaxID=69825 RepID=UPI00045E8989|nr:extracellular solute-binding protein [Lacrimispora indolis]